MFAIASEALYERSRTGQMLFPWTVQRHYNQVLPFTKKLGLAAKRSTLLSVNQA